MKIDGLGLIAGVDLVQLGLWIVAALMIVALFVMRWRSGRDARDDDADVAAAPVTEMEESLEDRLAPHASPPAMPAEPWRPSTTHQPVPATVLRRTLVELRRLDDPPPPSGSESFERPLDERAPDDEPSDTSLPTRSPRVVPATTAPARSLTDWRPATPPSATRGPAAPFAAPFAAPPPPTDAIDPATGEPDPEVYRQWLRQWLDFVESQP